MTYHARYEAQSRAQGYTLVATMPDYRRGGDRRRHPQSRVQASAGREPLMAWGLLSPPS